MRLCFFFLLAPLPATAWDFSPTPICTLMHQAEAAEIVITYDPATPQYSLYVTLRSGVWPSADTFGMVFEGQRRIQIGTSQHGISPDGTTLTVQDRGFGNVLDGLEFNDTAIAASGDLAVSMSLADAAAAVQDFRDCLVAEPALS